MQDTSCIKDKNYLVQKQYADSGNFSARIVPHMRFNTNPYSWHR